MSWSYLFVARSKEAAKAKIDTYAAQNTHFPAEAVAVVKAHVDFLPDDPKKVVCVTTSGTRFVYETGDGHGQLSVEVGLKDFVDDRPAEVPPAANPG